MLALPGGWEGLNYMVEHLRYYVDSSYIPTMEDILRMRIKTIGISETNFTIERNKFVLIDVGGQRSERRKWLHLFSDISAVLYLIALDEYDMVLEENPTQNRHLEALSLWAGITAYPTFRNTPFILFLNKMDLFENKIENIPLARCFGDYHSWMSTQPQLERCTHMEQSCKFMEARFRNTFSGNMIWVHVTNALDTSSCQKVFRAIQEVVIERSLKMSGWGGML
eukprot:TRINITY_DN3534_c0_g1_i11.p1 TRINITY_DN3534_c0_g1~~TRINITY_DN3534_c0_g1_i11.p1  ORF type:complete len:224 (+),score=33.48 TRINITY_DN3534_c0_g1_i11:598-1269(+)